MRILRKRRLSKLEITNIKNLIKQELSFRVRIRVNRQKYAKGSFNILPTKINGKALGSLNNAQMVEIKTFLKKNQLKGNPGSWQGFSYIYSLI